MTSSLPEKSRVGVDATLLSATSGELFAKKLGAKSIEFVCEKENLVDRIWNDRPAIPRTPVTYLSEEDAGETVESKVERVRMVVEWHSGERGDRHGWCERADRDVAGGRVLASQHARRGHRLLPLRLQLRDCGSGARASLRSRGTCGSEFPAERGDP